MFLVKCKEHLHQIFYWFTNVLPICSVAGGAALWCNLGGICVGYITHTAVCNHSLPRGSLVTIFPLDSTENRLFVILWLQLVHEAVSQSLYFSQWCFRQQLSCKHLDVPHYAECSPKMAGTNYRIQLLGELPNQHTRSHSKASMLLPN